MLRRPFLLLIGLIALGVALVGCQASPDSEISSIFVGSGGIVQSGDSDNRVSEAGATATPTFTSSPVPTATATPTPLPPLRLTETDNILLLGTDRRPDWNNWRTDSIMVVGLDREHKRAVVFSIPRDLYLEVPGYGQARINQVDYIGEQIMKVDGGGPALVSRVISDTLGISTEHWVRVEMRGFQPMVDALGGVSVHLTCPFYELIYDLDEQDWTYFTLPAGNVHMDGETAYRFVTLRYISSDFGRSQRQRQFLWALRNQALDTGLILRVPELWDAFKQTFATDLSLLEMIRLARFGLSIDSENVRSAALTTDELERYITRSGADVLRIVDGAKVQAKMGSVWSGESLAETGQPDPASCPSPPRGVPSYVLQEVAPGVAGGNTVDTTGGVGGGGGEPLPPAEEPPPPESGPLDIATPTEDTGSPQEQSGG